MSDPIVEVFTEGQGFKPSEDARAVITEGRIPRALSPELVAKIEGRPVPAVEKPAEVVTPAPTTSAAVSPAADPAKPAEQPPVGAVVPAPEGNAERDRLFAANQKLIAEAAERKPPETKPDRVEAYRDLYFAKGAPAAFRQFLADVLEHEPDHADVQSELADATMDLTSDLHKVPLDPAQKASRDVAQTRRILDRDKKARKAESDAATKGEQAKAETAKAQEAAAFIGNRLSQARPGSDGKPSPTLREQFPIASGLAQEFTGKPLEALILETYPALMKAGILDEKRSSDDDYLIAETAKYLDARFSTRYQALADAFGKAKPVSPPSTAKPEPAPTPDATASARKDLPQSHGGRTLTTADSSAAPATLPSTTPDQPKRPKSRAEFLRDRFPD